MKKPCDPAPLRSSSAHLHPVYPCYLIFFLFFILSACTVSTTAPTDTAAPTHEIASPTATLLPVTDTPLPTSTSTPKPPPAKPTLTPTLTPELLTCPDEAPPAESAQPLRFLYTRQHEVWLWDGKSATSQPIPLPAEAAYPDISPDGRYIAYLEKNRAYSATDRRVAEIRLWVYDRQTGEASLAAAFSTEPLHQRYPEAPYIYLERNWLADSSRLLVQVNPYPWGEGILQPTGPLYRVDVPAGTSQLLLSSGEYERISLRPDGAQVAALDTAAIEPDGVFDEGRYRQGMLRLIDSKTGETMLNLPLTLARNPWSFMPPNYAPNSAHLIVNVEGGLGVVDTQTGALQVVPLENTCLEENDCWWTDYVPVFWLPDSQSFYALQSVNDYFNTRAETTLSQVFLEAAPRIETLTVIHAGMVSFSPDRRTLTYWNQADVDEFEKNKKLMNWVTFYLMNSQELEPRRYTAAYGHRLLAWHPNSLRFLFTYSASGGANLDRDRLGVGNICLPPQELTLPKQAGVSQTRWLDDSHILVWTYWQGDSPSASVPGLYLYDLAEPDDPVFLMATMDDQEEPYFDTSQVVVLTAP